MNIAVVAMGKIGLPLAVQFASKGYKVFGCDVNKETIDLINRGIEPFPGEKYLSEKLKVVVQAGNLVATLNTRDAVSKAQVVIIAVPLFVDEKGNPNFEWIDSATRDIGQGLKPGTLVSYETTLPVGTTRDRFAKILRHESGLIAGTDFYLVFSPERVYTGRVFSDLRKYPKLVGGINPTSEEIAINFYESVLDFDSRPDLNRENGVWGLGSCEASELAKLAETTYRDVNIALANQFAKFAESNEIDFYKVIEACNSQPFSHIHQPGIAVGGHCIPIYPRMYLWNDPDASLVQEAREVNSQMPTYVVDSISQELGNLKGKVVVILGISYRGGVKESAFSGVFDTAKNLTEKGAIALVHDPFFTDVEIMNLGLKPYTAGGKVDVAILQANHQDYLKLSSKDFPELELIYDGRNFLSKKNFPGIKFLTIGKPKSQEQLN